MTSLIFLGTTTQRIYNNSTISPNFPDILPNPTNAYVSTVFSTQKIVWQNPSTIPNQFVNINPAQLASIQGFPIKKITFTPTILIISGFQIPDTALSGQGNLLLGFQASGPLENKNLQSNPPDYSYASTNPLVYSNIPVNVMSRENSFNVYLNIWNDSPVFGQAEGTNFTIDYILNITVEIDCFGLNLDSDICINYCTSTDNLKNETCTKDYIDFCFDTSFTPGATGPTIFSNNGENGCYTYFKSYLTTGPGPNVEIDNKLIEACSFLEVDEIVPFYQNSSTGPTGATGATGQGGPVNIQNICACHLDPNFYLNLQNEIAKLPGGNTVDLPDVCLFQPCYNPDSFPRVLAGKTCPVAPCINLADIQNNGNIQGNPTINQSCLNTKTSVEKYLIFIVPVAIIILIVIAVIIFLIIRKV